MSVKLLIAAESNSGKTTLTKSLTDSLIISHDGKRFPFDIPHANIPLFDSTAELIELVNSKIVAYEAKFGSYPKTVVFDSVSKIFDTLMDVCNNKHTGFKIYTELNKEINTFTSYVQNTLIASDMNVVLISHAVYNGETARYNLIGKGDFAKRGGFIAEVDEAMFIELKNSKRNLHFRSTKFPARTLHEELPDVLPVEEFNLQQHIELLAEQADSVTGSEL